MANKDIKLNIKLEQPSGGKGEAFINKLTLALGLSLSTAVVDGLDLSNLYIVGGLALIIIFSMLVFKKIKKIK